MTLSSRTLVFDEVVPTLRELGVMDDEVFNTIFVENARRWVIGELARERGRKNPSAN